MVREQRKRNPRYLQSINLNYGKYFTEGEIGISEIKDYTSHNTHRLDIDGIKNMLLKLEIICGALNA
jgi:UDP-glucose 4-epimerase